MNGHPQSSVSRIRPDRVWLLLLVLPMTFRTFTFFPVLSQLQEVWNALSFLYFLLIYPGWFSRNFKITSAFEWYIVGLIILAPFLTALAAWREFSQPFLYGLLAQRSVAVIASVLFLLRGMREKWITLRELERAMLVLAWGTAVLYVATKVTLNPANFSSYPGFTLGAEEFAFQGYFIFFGMIYYAFIALRRQQPKYYALALLLLVCGVQKKGMRQGLLFLFLTFFFFAYRWLDGGRLLRLLPKALLIFTVMIGALFVLSPDSTTEMAGKFNDLFTVILAGNNVEDPSANARIGESAIALTGFVKHPLLGNGKISVQWQGGTSSVLGDYFDANDVGLLGMFFSLGIVGVVLYSGQFFFAYFALRRIPGDYYSPMLDAVKGVLFNFGLSSISNGAFVPDVTILLIFVLLLRAMREEAVQQKALTLEG
ncbi:MAG: hypothetical protein P4L87_07930 [Formivibrio sp.]|nr:hypothetical protein [Formivibrio sp.]